MWGAKKPTYIGFPKVSGASLCSPDYIRSCLNGEGEGAAAAEVEEALKGEDAEWEETAGKEGARRPPCRRTCGSGDGGEGLFEDAEFPASAVSIHGRGDGEDPAARARHWQSLWAKLQRS